MVSQKQYRKRSTELCPMTAIQNRVYRQRASVRYFTGFCLKLFQI